MGLSRIRRLIGAPSKGDPSTPKTPIGCDGPQNSPQIGPNSPQSRLQGLRGLNKKVSPLTPLMQVSEAHNRPSKAGISCLSWRTWRQELGCTRTHPCTCIDGIWGYPPQNRRQPVKRGEGTAAGSQWRGILLA